MTYKIVYLTSVHPRYDTRIFQKMCTPLVDYGFDVSLVVEDGKGNEHKNGVHILDVGASKSRVDRLFKATKRVSCSWRRPCKRLSISYTDCIKTNDKDGFDL